MKNKMAGPRCSSSLRMFSSLRMIETLLVLFVILASMLVCRAQSNCNQARNCSECLSISRQCRWCMTEQFDPKVPRCSQHFSPTVCPPSDVSFPPSNNFNIEKDRPFSDSYEDTVQFRPQQIRAELAIGQIAKLDVHFKQAQDYPMDLYYLMDISCTMNRHKASVSRIGERLSRKIKQTTRDFRIGFGSFVDKETIPFSNYKVDESIKCGGKSILETYSFINHLNLTENTREFESIVRSAQISGNLDIPEGTLDALMQVMVCLDEIGWRQRSDKIIVVATDEEFHIAGDGKLGGVIIPNDGRCHLRNNRYIASTIYDYPSMHHIAEIAQRNKFNLIFTVSDKALRSFQILSEIIGPTARVAPLQLKDETIANLIDEVYRNISSSVELKIEDKPDNVDIEIWADCDQQSNYVPTTSCRFTGKAEIAFRLHLKLRQCKQLGHNHESVVRVGLSNKNETIEIDITELCRCDCENKGMDNAQECSGNGTFSCGICTKCNGKRSGQQCECDPDKWIDPKQPDAHCKLPGDTKPCSGRGQCVCAKCLCDPMFSGDFCQNDDSLCFNDVGVPNTRSLKCNNQGECLNQECRCDPNKFTGKFCDCPVDNSTCISPVTDELCSNNGECRCGKCECKTPSSYGQFCEHCPRCDAPMYCHQILSCLPHFQAKFCNPNLYLNATNVTNPCREELCFASQAYEPQRYKVVDKLDVEELDDRLWFNHDCHRVHNSCDISYTFRLFYTATTIFGSRPEYDFVVTKFIEICPQKVNLVLVGSSAFGIVILIGLLTIIAFKIATEYLDHREYQRFMKEVDAANFSASENPLYKDAKINFRNPGFALRERTSKFFSRLH